ncbi:MAG: hypothetical protein HZC03_00975 [Candidatus Lloydbacteria bacterium]|nr:hypothetical protein [Candidatus Lloydbacteria bacterium]
MVKRKLAKDTLLLLHSDKRIFSILDETNAYLEQNLDVKEQIQGCDWVFRSLSELAPLTPEKVFSGHIFPLTEAEYEIECSIVLCKIGFYKHAIASLRNVLELGLLSVYWDINDRAHIDIQNWLRSMEATPFRKTVFAKLSTNENIKTFDKKQNIFEKTAALYEKLSNFSHTRGFGYSSRRLNAHNSNVNSFNEVSLKRWLKILDGVVEIVTIFHVLKYPVALQHTPMDDKFGLNGPAGGFLNPHQMERLKKIVSKEHLPDLQKISDNDEDALSMATWVNEQPDITEADFVLQIEKQDQQSIEWEGYDHWLKNQRKLYGSLKKQRPEEYQQKLDYFKKMRQWAKKGGFLKPPHERQT